LDDEKFSDQVTGGLSDDVDKGKTEEFKKINQYVRGAYDEDEAFQNLEKELQKIADDKFGGESNRLYYLALPPSQFTALSEKIKKNNYKGLTNRLVIEKPFGKDTDTCRDMMEKISKDWKEEEIYRIDHFLGEEMVRNITHLRFANDQLIEPLLCKERVAAVKVELLEEFGCEGRGGYFDEFGMIRDVIQNHLLQVALAVAIEPPSSLEDDSMRDEKLKVLKSIKPVKYTEAVWGQYTKSGKKPGYLDDESVENKESKTETFASTVLYINTPRWEGVPFILKSGKALDRNLSRITIQLKPTSSKLFGGTKSTELRIEMIPSEKIYFSIQTKTPGLENKQTTGEMVLDYKSAFPNDRVPDAYETVIRAVLKGNQSLFVREDELIASWEIFTPLLKYLEGKESASPIGYEYGSSGPKEATELEKKVGFQTQ